MGVPWGFYERRWVTKPPKTELSYFLGTLKFTRMSYGQTVEIEYFVVNNERDDNRLIILVDKSIVKGHVVLGCSNHLGFAKGGTGGKKPVGTRYNTKPPWWPLPLNEFVIFSCVIIYPE
jgi:hypothetical protein